MGSEKIMKQTKRKARRKARRIIVKSIRYVIVKRIPDGMKNVDEIYITYIYSSCDMTVWLAESEFRLVVSERTIQ